jgi:hypothetical protein
MSANNNENIFISIFELAFIDPFIKQKQHKEKVGHNLNRAVPELLYSHTFRKYLGHLFWRLLMVKKCVRKVQYSFFSVL